MFERFDQRAYRAVVLAGIEARGRRFSHVGTESLLVGLLLEAETGTDNLPRTSSVLIERVRPAVAQRGGSYDEPEQPPVPDMNDPYELERFVAAQDGSESYRRAVAELRDGRKRSHWMWFVFPQIAGLGLSPISKRYAIASLDEAKAYLEHPVLGPRLIESARILTDLHDVSARDIFGGIDAMKLRSSMTLFALADATNPVFRQVLDAYFGGVPDEATERLLQRG